MNNKKWFIAIAFVFLLLGSGTFVFANPGTEELSSGSQNNVQKIEKEETKDNKKTDKEVTNNKNNSTVKDEQENVIKEENTNTVNNDDTAIVKNPNVTQNNTANKNTTTKNTTTTINNNNQNSNNQANSTNNQTTENNNSDSNNNNNNNNNENTVPSQNEEQSSGNDPSSGTEEQIPPVVDTTYEDALAVLENAEVSKNSQDISASESAILNVTDEEKRRELMERLNNLKETILNEERIVFVSECLDKMELDLQNANSKEDIDAIRSYREQEDVEGIWQLLKEGNTKTDLATRLENLAKVLDDMESPIIIGIQNNSVVQAIQTIQILDDNATTMYLNNQEITLNELLNILVDGTYTLKIQDSAFNENSVSFVVDTEEPEITGITNNAYYNENIFLNVNDANDTVLYVEKDGQEYIYNDSISEEGIYIVYATDEAGNQSITYTFTIDKTAPIISGVVNGSNVASLGAVLISDLNNMKIYLNDQEITLEELQNYTISGEYTLYAIDEAGNRTNTITFTLDTVPPIVQVSYEETETGSVIATISANEEIIVVNNNGSLEREFVKNGKFVFIVKDLVGNQVEVLAKVTTIVEEPESEEVVEPIVPTAFGSFYNGKIILAEPYTLLKVESNYEELCASVNPEDNCDHEIVNGSYTVQDKVGYTITARNEETGIVKQYLMFYKDRPLTNAVTAILPSSVPSAGVGVQN